MADRIAGALHHLAASVSSSVRRNSAGPEQFGSAPLHQSSSDVDLRALPSADSAAQLPSMSSPLPGGSAAGDDSSAFSVPLSSAASQQLAYARMLDDLPNKAEWSSLAHRGSIDPMQSEAANGTQPARPLFRKTGIICTIGPGTNSPSALADLRRAGMNIMRMNFSHGDHAYHQSAIDNLRKSFDVFPGPPVAIALDTKGPEIRTGTMRVGEVELKAGAPIRVSVDPEHKALCDEQLVYMDYANLPLIVQQGSLIFVDDGLISLRVDSVAADKRSVECTVINTGKLSSKKGVNLPGLKVDLPSISEQDAKDLAFGVEQGVDIVFASFIRKRDDILRIRSVLGEKGARIMIIAKIENQEGVQNFNAIMSECDGVMVARGDLGIEIPVQKVFLAQKMMIARCNIVGKPVICATQMLESMTVNPRPTRAEVSDVGNAVIDGADCVMLSGETAKGRYPNECVRMMHDSCIEAERTLHHLAFFQQVHSLNKNKHTNETLASAAVNASFEQDVQALIVLSVSGNTARLVAKYRPACPVICITTDRISSRQLHLTRGVYPVYCPLQFDPKQSTWAAFIDSMVTYGIAESQRSGERILNKGDIAIVVQGWTSQSGHTNTLRVIRI